ncbi:hypothetical protein NHX12_019958, partial [Muraenolepis orangiensis]
EDGGRGSGPRHKGTVLENERCVSCWSEATRASRGQRAVCHSVAQGGPERNRSPDQKQDLRRSETETSRSALSRGLNYSSRSYGLAAAISSQWEGKQHFENSCEKRSSVHGLAAVSGDRIAFTHTIGHWWSERFSFWNLPPPALHGYQSSSVHK